MKKIMSLILSFSLLFLSYSPVNAATNDEIPNEDKLISKQTYYVDEATLLAEQKEAEERILASLRENELQTRSDYDYIWTVEWGTPKKVTKGGYPGGQPSGGVKFSKPGGAFSWDPTGGPTSSANVSFTAPFQGGSITIDFGIAKAGEGLQYVQSVSNYTDYVKLYVNKTMEVKPYVTYRTHRVTGKKEVWTTGMNQSMYSFEFKVYKV